MGISPTKNPSKNHLDGNFPYKNLVMISIFGYLHDFKETPQSVAIDFSLPISSRMKCGKSLAKAVTPGRVSKCRAVCFVGIQWD